jgi:hypothetical protein
MLSPAISLLLRKRKPPTAALVQSFGNNSSGGGTATYTWTAANLGNPSYLGTRRVICMFVGASITGGNVLSGTIGGVAVTVHGFSCVAVCCRNRERQQKSEKKYEFPHP